MPESPNAKKGKNKTIHSGKKAECHIQKFQSAKMSKKITDGILSLQSCMFSKPECQQEEEILQNGKTTERHNKNAWLSTSQPKGH